MKKTSMRTALSCRSALLFVFAGLLSSIASAVGPQAPFTPPPSVMPPAADAAASEAEISTPQGLVGLRLGSTPSALIDGNWVRLGQDVRGARLIDVRQGVVRLRHANGQIETLALFADPTAAALNPRRSLTPSAAPRELP